MVINTQAVKTVYDINQPFSADGLVVTATYSDGTTKTLSDYQYNLTAPILSGKGAYKISVSYGKVTENYYVVVKDNLNGYAVLGKKTYALNKNLSTEDHKLFRYYDNRVEEITDYSITADTSSYGVKRANVTVNGNVVYSYEIAVTPEYLYELEFENRTNTGNALTLYVSQRTATSSEVNATGFYVYYGDTVMIFEFEYRLDGNTWISYFQKGTGTESILNDEHDKDHQGLFVTLGYDIFFANATLWHNVVLGW
jgi:hypothetical protein